MKILRFFIDIDNKNGQVKKFGKLLAFPFANTYIVFPESSSSRFKRNIRLNAYGYTDWWSIYSFNKLLGNAGEFFFLNKM